MKLQWKRQIPPQFRDKEFLKLHAALSSFPAPSQAGSEGSAAVLTPAQLQLRRMVLDSVLSPHSRRNYAKALDLLFSFAAGRPLTRALLMEYRSSMKALAPSTVNVRLAAVRKMVTEAKRNGMLSAEEADDLTEVPNVRQQGTRLGNWLTKEQARELLAVPDRSILKGKRDYAISPCWSAARCGEGNSQPWT